MWTHGFWLYYFVVYIWIDFGYFYKQKINRRILLFINIRILYQFVLVVVVYNFDYYSWVYLISLRIWAVLHSKPTAFVCVCVCDLRILCMSFKCRAFYLFHIVHSFIYITLDDCWLFLCTPPLVSVYFAASCWCGAFTRSLVSFYFNISCAVFFLCSRFVCCLLAKYMPKSVIRY